MSHKHYLGADLMMVPPEMQEDMAWTRLDSSAPFPVLCIPELATGTAGFVIATVTDVRSRH